MWQFCSKSSEWVKTLYFIFSTMRKKKIHTFETSEWVSFNFSRKKKYKKKNTREKNTTKNEITKIYLRCFFNKHLFCLDAQIGWTWTFFGKKIQLYFFPPAIGEKKNTIFSRFEWVGGLLLYRGKKKNTVPLVERS